MKIRQAQENDIIPITGIYDHILSEEEAGRATVGWVRGVYPTASTAQRALDAGTLFVLEQNGTVAAAAVLNHIQVPEYKNAAWKCANLPPEQILVMHTLVVDPCYAGQGLGSAFVRFYEQVARAQHCRALRMDTNARNQAARRLYRHLGFEEVGIVPCAFNGIAGVQLVCLEKCLP